MSSEYPKWIALVLSIVAIVVSTLSWMEARQNRIINQEVNRPFLTLALIQSVTYVQAETPEVSFKVTLKNDGRTQALVSRIVAKLELDQSTIDKVEGCEIGDYEPKAAPQTLDILPTTEKAFEFQVPFNSRCRKGDVNVEVNISVTYKEPGLGTEYSQTLTTSFDDLLGRR